MSVTKKKYSIILQNNTSGQLKKLVKQLLYKKKSITVINYKYISTYYSAVEIKIPINIILHNNSCCYDISISWII